MSAVLRPERLVCMMCKHEWIESLIYRVPILVWVAHVRSLRCPSCGVGSKKLAFRVGTAAGESTGSRRIKAVPKRAAGKD